jgi:hypothetical protein
LIKTVQSLLREAVVRKITVKDRNGRTLLEIPLYAGAMGVVLLGWWSALLLVAAWFTEVSIFVERVEETAEATNGDSKTKPAASTTAAEPSRCQAITKAGTQCKRTAVAGSEFCARHQPE